MAALAVLAAVFFALWVVTLLLWVRGSNFLVLVTRAQRPLTRPGQRDRIAASLLESERFIRDQEHEIWPEKRFEHKNCPICGPGPLLRGMVPSGYEHPFYRDERVQRSDGYSTWFVNALVPSGAENAEIVSSAILNNGAPTGTHTVMLDLDFPVTLVESSTAGHHHLYIDREIPWSSYRKLLRALHECDLIEHGFYHASLADKATHLRPPWVTKPESTPTRRLRKGGPVRPLNWNWSRKTKGKRGLR